MSAAAALRARPLAEELHALLRELDPIRWRDEMESSVRERFAVLRRRVTELYEEEADSPQAAALMAALVELARLLNEALPALGSRAEELQANWMRFRSRLQPAYEDLARSLRDHAIHVPRLRPSNLSRNVFHAGFAVFALVIVTMVPWTYAIAITWGFGLLAWGMETTRRISPAGNDFLMRLFAPVAHPHERRRINSATWYVTSLMILTATTTPGAAAVAVAVMGFGDPAAALIGRRFGRVRLLNGRSLEGSLSFFFVGWLVAAPIAWFFAPSLGIGKLALLTGSAALFGAVTELVSRRIDDNLSVPLAVGASASLVAMLLGVVF